jgi:hypothetical protein
MLIPEKAKMMDRRIRGEQGKKGIDHLKPGTEHRDNN